MALWTIGLDHLVMGLSWALQGVWHHPDLYPLDASSTHLPIKNVSVSAKDSLGENCLQWQTTKIKCGQMSLPIDPVPLPVVKQKFVACPQQGSVPSACTENAPQFMWPSISEGAQGAVGAVGRIRGFWEQALFLITSGASAYFSHL